MFRGIAYLLFNIIHFINIIFQYYIFPIGYIFYFLISDKTILGYDILDNFVFIISLLYSSVNIFYPLLCHNLPYKNYKFIN